MEGLRSYLADHDEDDPQHGEANHDGDAGAPGCLVLVTALVGQSDRMPKLVQFLEVFMDKLPRAVALASIQFHATVLRPCILKLVLHL